MKRELKDIVGLFVIWRLLLFFVGYFGLGRFGLTQNFYGEGGSVNFFKSWANWDGGHYIGIAQNGYINSFQHAFFPFYPILIKLGSFLTLGDYFLSAYLISTLSLTGGILVLYYFVKRYFDKEVAFRSIFYLLIFPTAFFLVSAYSESLFLLLSISAFYFADQRRWFLTGSLAALLSATRPVGILIFPALVIEYLIRTDFKVKNLRRDALYLLISPLGLLGYMYYLWQIKGDPLFFIHTQNYWQRSTVIVSPLEVLINNANVLIQNFPNNFYQFSILFPDYLFTILFLISSVYIFKKISKSMGVYTFLVTIAGLFSGSLTAQSRYTLVAFPFFILMAKWGENRLINLGYIMFSVAFLALFTVLFINGNWLA